MLRELKLWVLKSLVLRGLVRKKTVKMLCLSLFKWQSQVSLPSKIRSSLRLVRQRRTTRNQWKKYCSLCKDRSSSPKYCRPLWIQVWGVVTFETRLRIPWSGHFIGRGIVCRRRPRYSYAEAMEVSSGHFLSEAGTRTPITIPLFSTSNLLWGETRYFQSH